MRFRSIVAMLAATVLAAAFAPAAPARGYPAKPIRVVVPYPPGGGEDLTGRLLQQRQTAGIRPQ